jgi:hypothetical protein
VETSTATVHLNGLSSAITAPGAAPQRDGTSPQTMEETLDELRSMAARRTGRIPAELLARHIVSITEGGDWPLRRAAMEAIVRRCKFGERDGLVVTCTPAGSVFGSYVTGRTGTPGERAPGRGTRPKKQPRNAEPRPYRTVLTRLDPIAGSCDCPDYLRGSLGLCKHLICVLDVVHAQGSQLRAAPATSPGRHAILSWDPVRPLRGAGERLLGLRWTEGTGRGRTAAAVLQARGSFVSRRGAVHLAPDPRRLASLEKRRAFVGHLLGAVDGRSASLQAEPATIALLREERERLDRRIAGRAGRDDLLRHLCSLKRSLYPYQREGARRFFEEERLLLADDMGLGKTIQAVAACHALFHARRVTRGLLIVPAALKPQWMREWQATTDAPIASVDGRPEERQRQYAGTRRGFLVIGYEQLLRDLADVHAFDPEIVVLDEAQRIKNWETKSAAYVKTLRARYRLVLTGTPMENRLEELASVLDWLDDIALAPKWRLPVWHTYSTGDGDRGTAGARNLDTLRERLEPVLVRRVRAEVLKQLPSRTDTRVGVPMTAAQLEEHDALIPPVAQILARGRRRPLTQAEFLRLMTLLTQQRIISNGLGQVRFDTIWPAYAKARPEPALLEGLFSPKLAELRRILESVVVEQGRKVVVFSQWRKMLRLAAWAVGDILGDAGRRAVFFTGAESQTQRTRNIIAFHDEPDTAVMFLSDAGGVGLNLQRAASCCINLELPWNPAVLEQRIGRIYRLGQRQPIDVYNLVSEQGIEARIATLVATKRALFSGLFDGTTDEVQFEGGRSSFLLDVEKLVPEVPDLGRAAVEDKGDDGAAESGEAAEPERGDAPPMAPVPSADSYQHGPAAAVTPSVAGLFAAVRVERTAAGGVRLEAPPEAAASLVALFEGMARLLGRVSTSPTT